MAAVRWGRSSLEVPPTNPHVNWGRSELSGTAPASSRVNWSRSELSGTASVAVAPVLPQTVMPETLVAITPSLIGGATADFYTWRRLSGPVIALTVGGTGVVSFRAPSAMLPGTTLVLGVVASLGGTLSPEMSVTVNSYPQGRWSDPGGANWVGQRPTVPL